MSDFGEGKWVMGSKEHRCEGCYGPIPTGEEHHRYKGKYDGEWQNWRMHRECFDGWVKDGGEEFMPGDWPTPERITALVRARGNQ